jgi:hypothetical protein
VLGGTWGTGPLAVDALTALVEKERGIAGAGMKLVHVVRDQLQAGVVPRPGPDPVPCVGVLVGVRRIPFDAEVRAPRALPLTGGSRQPLAGRIGAGQTTEITGHAGDAGHEEGECRSGRARRPVVVFTASSDKEHDQKQTYSHSVPPGLDPEPRARGRWRKDTSALRHRRGLIADEVTTSTVASTAALIDWFQRTSNLSDRSARRSPSVASSVNR